MAKFPYATPEIVFIVLVMLLPLGIGFVWRAESFGGFIARVGISSVVGLIVWIGWIFLICKRHDQSANKRKNETLK